MFRKRKDMEQKTLFNCHDGVGDVLCTYLLRAGDSQSGIRFVHDDIIQPGSSIGEHEHIGEEELYYILEGHGTMILDGEPLPIGPGDVSLVRSGHTHGLINTGDHDMRLLVLCVKPSLAQETTDDRE
jgi:mannose-6-phosphate isomerase-like protein (cupin superfamily)